MMIDFYPAIRPLLFALPPESAHAVTLQRIRAEFASNFPLVDVGGMQSAADALAMRVAGADLVQIHTGLICRGPALISEILNSFVSPHCLQGNPSAPYSLNVERSHCG